MTKENPDLISKKVPQRSPIVRSSGVTETERQLANLADHSFLNLWSYPNLYIDKRQSGVGSGKELCDLLVVCGDDILIFSEKHIRWPEEELEVAWSRWFKKAVKKSVNQVLGAERWINNFPDRIFLDPQCKERFPISLPKPESRRIHGITVARGAGDACKAHFAGGTGSFAIDISIKGDAHWDADANTVKPFWVGDLNPNGTFIHVLDDGSLDTLLSELDTIADFTEYLIKKEKFLRSKYFGMAHGEEDLYGYYALHFDENNEHEFVEKDGKAWPKNKLIAIDGSHYTSLLRHPQYQLKKEADKESYVWDKLILNFTNSILDGTSIQPRSDTYDLSKSEIAVREMALEKRFERRHAGAAVADAVRNFDVKEHDAFIRQILPSEQARRATGFFFYITNFDTWKKEGEYTTYEEYRKARYFYAELYAKAILLRHAHLQKVVGISVQAPFDQGSSEDLIYAERWDCSPDEEKEIWAACNELGIMRSDMTMRPMTENEYPDFPDDVLMFLSDPSPVDAKNNYPNRKQRRAAMAKARKCRS